MLKLLKRFRDDERGAFLVLFGVLAVVLVATSGAVVDYTTVEQARTRGQVALDSAALALQPSIFTQTEEQIRQAAEDLMIERIGDSTVSVEVESADIDTADGQLLLQARLTIPTSFIGLVGVDEINARLIAEATRKQLFLEVAFVLDNSTSMAFESRMTNLKLAAKCATNVIFYGECNPSSGATKQDNVRIGIVPFAQFVNIGDSYENATWMDQTGISSISNDNFDDDDNEDNDFTDAVSRFDLYDELDEDWEGCVEARHYPYSVNDAVPSSTTPDTLFVPVFQPDEPDGWSNSYIEDDPENCQVVTPGTNSCFCYKWSNSWRDGGQICYEYDSDFDLIDSGVNACSCNSYFNYEGYSSYYGHMSSYWCVGSPGGFSRAAGSLSDRELQERLCKYEDANPSYYGNSGPNSYCLDTEVLALTDNPNTVTSRINAMDADGYTNIHQGAIWGFRVLSPTLPFDEGREYDTATSKVMILMTDGENTFVGTNNMNGSSLSQAYGHYYNAPDGSGTSYQLNGGRLGYSVNNRNQMPSAMNILTEEACENAKAAGITIYTIGLEPPNTPTQTMLENCASGASYAYFPDSASELTSVFQEIASQLSALRLAQ